jgi:hypothetical protein
VFALLTLGLAGLSGCATDPIACTAESVTAIEVEVRDALSAAALRPGARGHVREGSYKDALTVRSLTTLAGAFDRPGTYSLHVEAEGYAAWDTVGLTAARGECHFETVAVTARISRQSPSGLPPSGRKPMAK